MTITTRLPLGDTVTVSGTGLAGGDSALVGSPPIWDDATDASYAEIVGQYSGPGQPQFTGSATALVEAPSEPLPSRARYVYARVRLAATAGTNVNLPRVSLTGPGDTLSVVPDALAPMSPTWVEYVFTQSPDSLIAAPDAYEFNVFGAFYSPAPNEVQRWRIYEAQLWLKVFGGAPPCRIFPREDGLGVAAGRTYPPPKSQQGSNRGVGYY